MCCLNRSHKTIWIWRIFQKTFALHHEWAEDYVLLKRVGRGWREESVKYPPVLGRSLGGNSKEFFELQIYGIGQCKPIPVNIHIACCTLWQSGIFCGIGYIPTQSVKPVKTEYRCYMKLYACRFPLSLSQEIILEFRNKELHIGKLLL